MYLGLHGTLVVVVATATQCLTETNIQCQNNESRNRVQLQQARLK